jgi:hypothetical protein
MGEWMQQSEQSGQQHPGLDFDPADDMAVAHDDPRFSHTLQVYHDNWFGIASASAALPGHKLRLKAETLDAAAAANVASFIARHRINRVCFQGFSEAVEGLLCALRRLCAADVGFYAVGHVTATQFQAPFEIRMQAAMRACVADGILRAVGSVKPHFHEVVPGTWPRTILNFCPRLPPACQATHGHVFIPVENHWRKGLYTNLIAALRAQGAGQITCVHEPKHLELLEDISDVRVTGFLSRAAMHGEISKATVVMNVSLAECQPMTQLEAFALGRPCLTGPLGLEEFDDDPLIKLCTVTRLDTPHDIILKLEALLEMQSADPAAIPQMTGAHVARRNSLAATRYAEFLDL